MKDIKEYYLKYRVEKLEDPAGKHDKCKYFVLDPQHDPHAKKALKAYAESCREEYPVLAVELENWAQE